MLRRPLAPIADDTEDAPWMVMGSPQSDTAAKLYTSLQTELRGRGSSLFVATVLPIRYQPDPGHRVVILSPDLLVAPVSDRPRSSYAMAIEGVPPDFVLEIISPDSKNRDLGEKPDWYAHMGVREYAIFAPETPDGRQLMYPPLQGLKLAASGDDYEAWRTDEQGRLYSEALDLWLIERGGELRAQRTDGALVRSPEESEMLARETDAEARARRHAEERAWRAEEELSRLREELARHVDD